VLSSTSTVKSEDNIQLYDYLLGNKSVGLEEPLLDARAASAELGEEHLLGLKRITRIIRAINRVDLIKEVSDAGNFENTDDATRGFRKRWREMIRTFAERH
jgi:hypothetical protein